MMRIINGLFMDFLREPNLLKALLLITWGSIEKLVLCYLFRIVLFCLPEKEKKDSKYRLVVSLQLNSPLSASVF